MTATHPLGSKARVLLTSVFGPYARDDSYGSRKINPMELYHNQVTRVQGPFSLRIFHRSWGLMLIQANMHAPSTLLDFPSIERFIQELVDNSYDIVGIGSIVPNVGKVRHMCTLIRRYSPKSVIVVGGHVASIPDLSAQIDADHIVRGEGVRWFRHYLGEDEEAPIIHPDIVSAFGTRILGLPLPKRKGDIAATLIPSVGCPLGCNFCTTSSLFGGKGHFVNFYTSGEELFRIMEGLESRLAVRSFFIMDENFLLHKSRALELLELMESNGKSWSLYVFSSASSLRLYTMEQLVRLGISWVWMGIEGKETQYAKLNGVSTKELVGELHDHGIKVLGSSIIGLDNHTPGNISEVIDYAVGHNTDFHQFMLYIPFPGTPLYEEKLKNNTLLTDMDPADNHGQYRFAFRHPHISGEQSEEFLLQAFRTDFEMNGPSILRVASTLLKGWRRYKNHPDARIRARFQWEAKSLRSFCSGLLWAIEHYFKKTNQRVAEQALSLRCQIKQELGIRNYALNMILGRFLLATIRQEDRRLSKGMTLEPRSFVDRKNWTSCRT
jgi:radical SAM superfamily enzyme YgiQ (UPF0313 family)